MNFREQTWGLRFRLLEMSSRNWLVIPCVHVGAIALTPDHIGLGGSHRQPPESDLGFDAESPS